MARNGSGTYVLPAGNPVTTGTTISSTWANTTLSDMGAALTTSISTDGQTTPAANLPMGGFAHTGVGNATVRTQYASAAQVQDGALEYLGSVSGTDTITASAAVGMSAYTVGQTFRFVSAGANTTTAVTININGIGAKNITKSGANALSVGDLTSGTAYQVTYDGTQFQLVMPPASNATYTGFKNRIINGAMVIDQRNAGASVALSSSVNFISDRFIARTATGTGNTGQQVSTAPSGFINSLKVTIGTGASPITTAFNAIYQNIEGLNVADLGWGTASAQTITLSFKVYSSLTGTFTGSLSNSAGTRSYPYTYSIPVANTWTTISVTIAGDTTGTWLTNNSAGIVVYFDLGTGATFQGTAGAWAGADYRCATGGTQLVGTSGATFYITGVQLEKGTTATSFDYRPYGTELALCQRYYLIADMYLAGYTNSGTANQYQMILNVQMRTTPTVNVYASTNTNTTGATIYPIGAGYVRHASTGSALGGFISAATATLSSEL